MPSREPSLHIRVGMDVYNAYQDRYIGTVARVFTREETAVTSPVSKEDEAAGDAPGYRILGESLGPFPTGDIGNSGPYRQSAAQAYATTDRGEEMVWRFDVRPGRLNLGPLTPTFSVPASAVKSVSMERVVVDLSEEDEHA